MRILLCLNDGFFDTLIPAKFEACRQASECNDRLIGDQASKSLTNLGFGFSFVVLIFFGVIMIGIKRTMALLEITFWHFEFVVYFLSWM